MHRTHNRVALSVLTAVVILVVAYPALAASTSNISATVTVQNISVSTTGPIAFGVVAAGSATVASDSSVVTNDGNVAETFSLNVTSPSGWTAVQAAPGSEEYCLSGMLNAAKPASGDFSYANDALSVTATSCSVSKFAGDQTGVSVAASGTRNLWFKFQAPSATTATTQKTITVTVTAAAA